jgi:hypothetical protein
VEELFQEAAGRRPAERAAWLEAACGEDGALLREVTALLDADERARNGGFIAEAISGAAEELAAPRWPVSAPAPC